VRRLRAPLALLLAAVGLSGCGVDGSLIGRPAGPGAAQLLTDSRAGFGQEASIRIVARERTRDRQTSTTTTSLQFRGVDIAARQSDGIVEDLRVLDGSAWSRGNPLYWVSSQGLEASQVPLVSRGWDAMRPQELHLPGWFVHALSSAPLLERCEVPSIPGGTLRITGHTSIGGRASTVLTDRAARGGESERIVVASAPPDVPEEISFTGGFPADPACGVSAAAARRIDSATLTYEDVNGVQLSRPRATLDRARYEQVVRAPAAASATVPASLARAVTGRHTMSGRVAATLGVRGDHVGETMSLPWTISSRCAGARCRLRLTVGDGTAVPVRDAAGQLFARPRFANRCSQGDSREIPTEVGLTVHQGRLLAWSTEATTACGGPSADYLIWQGR
jgi:hypothetical protein